MDQQRRLAHWGSGRRQHTLHINDEGLVISAKGYVGRTSSGNTAVLNGTGSIWHCSGEFQVGRSASSNSLRIENGAALVLKKGDITIGRYVGVTSNSLVVTGGSSIEPLASEQV